MFDLRCSIAGLVWHPHAGPVFTTFLVAALAAWGVLVGRRMRTRMSRRKAAALLVPKLLILALLVLALLDPAWRTARFEQTARSLIVLLDTSASMEVRDGGGATRLDRARAVADRLERDLPPGVSLRRLAFDTALHDGPDGAPAPPAGTPRGTDLGAVIQAAAARSDVSSALGVVLITDGGDEVLDDLPLPPVPLHVVGIGEARPHGNDLAIADVEAPASVEKGTRFEVRVDLSAEVADNAFAAASRQVPVSFERLDGDTWTVLAQQPADLVNRRARLTFDATPDGVGLQSYRVAMAALPGEASELNNTRLVQVDVRKQTLNVLFFTRELGSDLKMIRRELATDPGIAFTALFRTIGERFTVQGARMEGDATLDNGFPERLETLQLFDCIIIGSFGAGDWRPGQIDALVRHVEAGGGVIFLGGQDSFAQGGYGASPLATLFPWRLAPGQAGMEYGAFPVSVPAAAADHPVVAGVRDALLRAGSAEVDAVNPVGSLKPGAVILVSAGVGDHTFPLVAVQRVGRGRVMAVLSNTMWKWARASGALREAFGLFWRQAVRFAGGYEEGGGFLDVTWDKPRYRPAECARVEIRARSAGRTTPPRLTATLACDSFSEPLAVEPLESDAQARLVRVPFRGRGLYRLTLQAYEGDTVLETYEKSIPIGPLLPEGARLALDERFLAGLAGRGSGLYVPETGVAALGRHLAAEARRVERISERSLVHGSPVFLAVVLLVLVAEWILRRTLNLF